MELLLIPLLGYGAWWAGLKSLNLVRHLHDRTHQRQRLAAQAKMEVDRRRAEAYAHDQRLRLQNRQMQAALLELEGAPDFQRAAWYAACAKDVPLAFRQRQFHRFRGKLLEHLHGRLAAGGDHERLRGSLVELARNLGVASFEVDYLWHEAEGPLARQSIPTESTFATETSSRQREHEQRLTVIQSLTGIDPELREQLLEAEQERFREAMLDLNEQPAPTEI